MPRVRRFPATPPCASSSRKSDSSRRSSACRASTGTRSRPATPSSIGSTRRRTATRRNASSSFIGSCSGCSASASQSAVVSARRNPSNGRTNAPRRCGHAREAGARRAAENVEQHGFGLVVGGVRDEHRGRAVFETRGFERGVPCVTRAFFEVRPRRDLDGAGVEAHTEVGGERGDVARLVRALGTEAVVDVHRDRREPGVGGEHEERNGIGAARTSHDHRRGELGRAEWRTAPGTARAGRPGRAAVTRPGRASFAVPAARRATAATPGPATRRRSPAGPLHAPPRR